MKKIILASAVVCTTLFFYSCTTQELNNALNTANSVLNSTGTGTLSQGEAGSGIKEALINGITKGTSIASQRDGFFKNTAMKILLPPEAQNVESKLRALGMGSLVDNAIESMNRGAEDASQLALPIFKSAITSMTLTDALNILKGSNDAATNYLKGATTAQLKTAFKPTVTSSLNKVNATKYWNDVFSTYNKIPGVNKVNPDLSDWVTQKAIDGLFLKIKEEEANIRANPVARTSDLLKKVFGWAASNKK